MCHRCRVFFFVAIVDFFPNVLIFLVGETRAVCNERFVVLLLLLASVLEIVSCVEVKNKLLVLQLQHRLVSVAMK